MTAEEITTILGPVDETLITEMNQTGATPNELAQAWAWINADDARSRVNDPGPQLRTGHG